MRILRRFQAQAVIGVGGYAAGPATIAAVLLRIPVVLFEPNVVPGYANRAVARFAANAAVHFAQTGRWFRSFEVTGVPVRPAFFALPARRSQRPTLLVFGGSQGARALNHVVRESAAQLFARIPDLSLVHQTGNREFEDIRDFYAEHQIPVEVSAFIDDMPQRFADADLIVCRSGASTVAEIAAAGKCALFVPFPGAADDHQLRNAELLAAGRCRAADSRERIERRAVCAGSDGTAWRRGKTGNNGQQSPHPGASRCRQPHRRDGSQRGEAITIAVMYSRM